MKERMKRVLLLFLVVISVLLIAALLTVGIVCLRAKNYAVGISVTIISIFLLCVWLDCIFL